MLILQIDASSELCSVALSHQGVLLHTEINIDPYQHGRDINVLIEDLLNKSGYRYTDIQGISINKGPGSYTALRIGMATAKGLCYGLDIPLVAPSGLEILIDYATTKFPNADYYVPLIDARRMEVYTTDPVRHLSKPLTYETKILTEHAYSQLAEHRVCFVGNGVGKWKKIWPVENQWVGEHIEVDAGMMTRISHKLIKSDNISDLFTTTPVYIKKPNITTSKKDYFI